MGWPSKRSLLLRVIGPRRLGALYFAWNAERRMPWGGPFNGQAQRCLLFSILVERLRPVAIVETGTHLGATTEWMAAFQIELFTCENSKESFGFAQARLRPIRNVTVTLGDSRDFLRCVLKGPLMLKAEQDTILFYLDAHWGADLPLAEEIEIIFSLCPRAIVLIDDFEVPGDPGYGFDSYGPCQTLNAFYLAPVIRRHRLAMFYPSTPSSMETGMRRGCVALCADSMLDKALRTIPLLRRADSDANAEAD